MIDLSLIGVLTEHAQQDVEIGTGRKYKINLLLKHKVNFFLEKDDNPWSLHQSLKTNTTKAMNTFFLFYYDGM